MRKWLLLIILSLLLIRPTAAQSDTAKVSGTKAKKIILATGSAALTVGSLIYLNQAWYSEYHTGKFHFFNDNQEWLQMDKAGHVFSNYQMARLMPQAFNWAGYSEKKSLWIGGTIGFAYMTAIECMDGFSNGWGFSWGDQAANAIGAALAISQRVFWKEQRVQLKFSFAQSGLAKYNPSLLGENFYTQIIKDYNGQTYWLSLNPSSFMKTPKRFPKWLNIAFGYSAFGMLGGHGNNFVVQDADGNVLKIDRERRFLFSLDIDLTRIRTRSKFLKGLFSLINIVKIPAPAIQLSQKGLRAHYIYF
jgi:hypothetical protein